MKHCLILVLAAFSSLARAQTLHVQSKSDQYDLVLRGGSGSVNGKPADLSTFKDLLPLLTGPLSNNCPAGKPAADVTVREGNQTRTIDLKKGVVSDGTNCLTVNGEGLLFFPVHRDFLIGPKDGAIPLKSPLKIFRDGVKVAELVQKGAAWVNADPSQTLNFDFMERFENSLKNYSVRFRALPEMGKDKAKFVLQLGNQSYQFYKVTAVLWAVKKPGVPWLEASDDWSFWYDLDAAVLQDRFAAQIALIKDRGKDKAARLAALQKLETGWSPNVRELYHKLLQTPDEDHDLQALALRRLRSKPATETAGVIVEFLRATDDEDFKKQASQILKINNPKGPLYKPEASATERAKVVEFWSQWWTKNQNKP